MADLKSVKNNLEELQTRYPAYQMHFKRCYDSIKREVVNQLADDIETFHVEGNPVENKKKRAIKRLLEESIAEDLDTSLTTEEIQTKIAQGFTNEDCHEVTEILKTLRAQITQHQIKAIKLSERSGFVLQLAKQALSQEDYLSACTSSGYTPRYCEFLIWLHKLMQDYPKLKKSTAPIRTFMGNQKIVTEICRENRAFWAAH